MTAVRYSTVHLGKALRSGCVFDESKLERTFIKSLHLSICYSIRTYWVAPEEATLHSLARHMKSLVKLWEGCIVLRSCCKNVGSGRNSSKPSRSSTRITPVSTMREKKQTLSSSSKGKKKKGGSQLNRHSKNRKTSTTVGPIIQQQRASVRGLQKNSGFCQIVFTRGHLAEECLVFSLQVGLTLRRQREKMMDIMVYKRNWSTLRGRSQYYQHPISRSHRFSTHPTVA